jgi:hypothetical protein
MQTSILIRVQARGGKFLGPDIGFSTVTVRNAATGAVLASGAAGSTAQNSDSGELAQTVSNNASSGVVLTYPGPQVWYLTANVGKTAFFQANFDIESPMLIEISAAACGITASGTMWIEPGSQLLTEPGYIVTMPGLAVGIIAVKAANEVFAVTAKVTMMCGCPINDAQTDPDGPIQWPSSEFQVWGEMRSGGVAVTRAPFNLQQTSIYYGAVPVPKTKGSYELAVVAVQASEANAGIDTQTMQI